MASHPKFLDRQIEVVIGQADRGQEEDAFVDEVLDRLTPEQRKHVLRQQLEVEIQAVVDEKVAAGELIDNGDGTYSKAV